MNPVQKANRVRRTSVPARARVALRAVDRDVRAVDQVATVGLEVANHLLDKERVALGLLKNFVEEGGRRGSANKTFDERRGFIPGERSEDNPLGEVLST